MIKLEQLANYFEEGLNAQLTNDEVQFKIWAEAGQHTGAHRSDNKLIYYLDGNLRTSTSANEANDLIMGVNGLSLDFAIPINPPRTNAAQTTEELAKIKDGQYPFVQYMVNAINSYFQKARAIMLTDGSGNKFTVAFQAGTAVSGDVDMFPNIGNAITVSVYIEVYFIEGGINSKDVIVYFNDGDGAIPFMAARYGRTPVLQTDVYSGSLISKSLITSTAFAIDIDFPLNSDNFSKSYLNYLLTGEPNEAHFVNVVFGNAAQELFLMTFNAVQSSATGISIAGGSASLVEVVDNPEAVNIPDGYHMGRFILPNSQIELLTFQFGAERNVFIAGEARVINGTVNIPVSPKDIVYDDTTDKYYVYMIVNGTIPMQNSNWSWEEV